jgi:hypothetical protein
MCQIESTHRIHNPRLTPRQHKLLEVLLERNAEPSLGVQDPHSVFPCGFLDRGFSFGGAGDVFCACGAEELVGPVGKCPVQYLKDKREFPEETGYQAGSETRGIGIRCPVLDSGSLLSARASSRKERCCCELGVGTSYLAGRLALRLYGENCVHSTILILASVFC